MMDVCCPTCCENAERDLGTERLLTTIDALNECERNEHAGLELLGSLRALAAAFVLVVVAVAWRRRG